MSIGSETLQLIVNAIVIPAESPTNAWTIKKMVFPVPFWILSIPLKIVEGSSKQGGRDSRSHLLCQFSNLILV